MGGDRNRALLCAGLLASGRPLSATELRRLIHASQDGLEREIEGLKTSLLDLGLGLEIDESGGTYRLVVQSILVPDLASILAPAPLPHLSNAALETLALVAYRQPITRGELEAARGASCSSTLETLQERELVKVVGQKEVVGKPLLYATTERFLWEFGLRTLDDLPVIEEQPGEFLRG